MKQTLLHTPEGVRDIYNGECERKIVLEDNMMNCFKIYGYHPIQTPTFEFFDIFGKEIGSTSSNELYKFFDQEGNTLVLRPDITPSIARCAAKYFMDEAAPMRLCYIANTFINNKNYQGRLKECTQAGAELIGDASVDADAEMIALAIQSLKDAGLSDFQISIGHVDYLGGLFEAAGMDEESEILVREFINNKNFYGVDEIVVGLNLPSDLNDLFSMLHEYAVTTDTLQNAKAKSASYPKIYNALDRLEQLDRILELYGVAQYVSYELAMLSNLEYYTGMIFAGYTFGTGEAIVKGGRYDQLLHYFGKDAPATGFCIVIDQLMAALSRQNISINVNVQLTWIVYDAAHQEKAIQTAQMLRNTGKCVELMKVSEETTREMYEASALAKQVKDIIYCV